MCIYIERARERERKSALAHARARFYLFFDGFDSGSFKKKVVDSGRMVPEVVCERESAQYGLCGISLLINSLAVSLSLDLSLSLSLSLSLFLSLSCVYPPAKAANMAKRRVGVEYSPSYAGARAPRQGS